MSSSLLANVTITATVNGQVITDFIQSASITQSFFKHDIATLRIEYLPNRNLANLVNLWPVNAPVQLSWGQGTNNVGTWYGYVNHSSIQSNSDSGNYAPQVTYTCVGTSKPMNTEDNQIWGQVSPSYIATQIAAQHQLRAVVTNVTTFVTEYEAQVSESDWHFLIRIAKKYGFVFYVSGGSLYFIDPAAILTSGNAQTIPVFTSDKNFVQNDTVRDFRTTSGDNIPGSEVANRQLSYVDTTSGRVVTVQAQNQFGANATSNITKIHTGFAPPDQNTAQALVNAWQANTQFYNQATAELWGNIYVYPGKTVNLQGQAMMGGTTGLWMVSEATHILKATGSAPHLDKFVTQTTLMRNTTTGNPTISIQAAVNPEFVTCTLGNGVWSASGSGSNRRTVTVGSLKWGNG